jgi:hypothetical protein
MGLTLVLRAPSHHARVTVVSPRDAVGDPMSESAYRDAIKGGAAHIRIVSKGLC